MSLRKSECDLWYNPFEKIMKYNFNEKLRSMNLRNIFPTKVNDDRGHG